MYIEENYALLERAFHNINKNNKNSVKEKIKVKKRSVKIENPFQPCSQFRRRLCRTRGSSSSRYDHPARFPLTKYLIEVIKTAKGVSFAHSKIENYGTVIQPNQCKEEIKSEEERKDTVL